MMNEGNDEEEEGTTTNDTTRDGKGRERNPTTYHPFTASSVSLIKDSLHIRCPG